MSKVQNVTLKPQTFEAVQYNGTVASGIEVLRLLESTGYAIILHANGSLFYGSGRIQAQKGCWFVKNGPSDFDIVPKDSFETLYDIQPEVEIDLSEYVPSDFKMDPETMDVVRGSKLKNGDLVLVQSLAFLHRREELVKPDLYPHTKRDIEEQLRWCRVTDIKFDSANGGMVDFIGLYNDGTKAKRSYNVSHTWYILKDDPKATFTGDVY